MHSSLYTVNNCNIVTVFTVFNCILTYSTDLKIFSVSGPPMKYCKSMKMINFYQKNAAIVEYQHGYFVWLFDKNI